MSLCHDNNTLLVVSQITQEVQLIQQPFNEDLQSL